MDKNVKITILSIFLLILDILGIVCGFIFDIDVLIVIFIILSFVILPILIYYLIITIKAYLLNNSIATYKYLDSNFSKLYINCSDGNRIHSLAKYLKYKKLGLGHIKFSIKPNMVCLNYIYIGFEVNMNIYNDCIKYQIFTSLKYSKGANKYKIYGCKEKITDDDLTIDGLCNIVSRYNSLIDAYMDNNTVDDYFNGRLFEKLSNCKNSLLVIGIAYSIFSLLLIICVIPFMSFPIEDNKIFVISIIVVCILIAVIIGYVGIENINRYINLLKDFKKQKYFKLYEKPKRVSFVIRGRGRGFSYTIDFIKLYFKGYKVLVALPYLYWINSFKNIKECKKEIKKMNCSFAVLKRSKIVVSGENKIINVVDKYLK